MAVTINGTTGVAGVDGSASTPALQGTDTNTGVSFGTDIVNINTGGTERARVDANGAFHIKSAGTSYNDFTGSSDAGLVIGSSSNSNSGVMIRTGTSGTGRLNFGDGDGSSSDRSRGFVHYSHSSNSMSFGSDASTRMTIDSSGKVGIGTTSPDQSLHVHKGSAGSIDSTANSVLTLENSGDSILQFLSPNNVAQQIRFGDPEDNGAGYIDYNHGNNVLSFGVSGPEKMRILSDGHVCIGRTDATIDTSNFGTSIGGGGIYVSRNVTGASHSFGAYGNQGNALVMGDGDLLNTNGSYGSLSDETLKQDIVDAASQWDDIKNIRVRKFRFKDNPKGPLQIGVVAQEIEKVSAGLVSDRYKDGRADSGEKVKSVKYSVLHMKAVKALQEAMARIETLEAKVAALEAA